MRIAFAVLKFSLLLIISFLAEKGMKKLRTKEDIEEEAEDENKKLTLQKWKKARRKRRLIT